MRGRPGRRRVRLAHFGGGGFVAPCDELLRRVGCVPVSSGVVCSPRAVLSWVEIYFSVIGRGAWLDARERVRGAAAVVVVVELVQHMVLEELLAEALLDMDCEGTGGVSLGALLAYIASNKRASLKVLNYGAVAVDPATAAVAEPQGSVRRNQISRAAAPPE